MAAQQPSDLGYEQALRYAEELRELYETERARRAELQAANDRLNQTEAKYRALVEGLPAIVYEAEFGEAGAWRYVSPQIETILGFPPEEWMADPELWYRQLHPEDKTQALADERRARDTGEPLMSEYRMLSRDGRVVWFRDEAVVLRGDEGEGRSLQGVMYDITDRKHAEEALRRRERILEAVSFTAEEFLKGGAWQENIQEVLARLGQAADASRIYICQNHRADDGALLQSMRHEWMAPGISPQIDNPAEQAAPYSDGFSRWEEALGQGRIIQGHVRDFPAAEQQDLTHEDIRSMAVVPIFVRGDWWGYIGFDECLGDREWSYAELGALKAAADTLGAAIQRQAAEDALRRYSERVEGLRQIDLAILKAQSVEEIVQSAILRLQDLVPSDGVRVSLVDSETQELVVFSTAETLATSVSPGARIPIAALGSFGTGLVDSLRAGQNVIIADLPAVPDLSPALEQLRDEDVRSLLATPLLRGGELVGVLSLRAREAGAFDGEDADIAGEVANQLAIAIHQNQLRHQLEEELAERKRAQDALRRYNQRLESLRQIDLAILSAQTIEELIQAALSRLQGLVPSRRATVWLMDFEAGTATVFVTSTSPAAGLAPGVQYPIERWGSFGESVIQKLRGGEVDVRHDLAEESDLSPGLQALRDEGIRSLLVAPLLERGDLLGVIGLYADEPEAFSKEHADIAGEVANQLAIAIRQNRLRQGLEDELSERKRAEEKLRKTFADLRTTDEQRQRLLSHLTMAQEEERSRIASDIHDDTIQVMTAVGMRLDILRRELQLPQQIALLEHLEETVTVATGRLRNLLFELHPPTLDRDGLAAALRVYLEQNQEQTGLAYTLEDRLAGEPAAETRVILYRIAQEALANVRKHARASSVAIVLDSHVGGFLVRITDDGGGFLQEDALDRLGHLGLASIRERAETAGGWSRIDSAPGKGTTVEFWLPERTASTDGRADP